MVNKDFHMNKIPTSFAIANCVGITARQRRAKNSDALAWNSHILVLCMYLFFLKQINK